MPGLFKLSADWHVVRRRLQRRIALALRRSARRRAAGSRGRRAVPALRRPAVDALGQGRALGPGGQMAHAMRRHGPARGPAERRSRGAPWAVDVRGRCSGGRGRLRGRRRPRLTRLDLRFSRESPGTRRSFLRTTGSRSKNGTDRVLATDRETRRLRERERRPRPTEDMNHPLPSVGYGAPRRRSSDAEPRGETAAPSS